MYAALNKNQQLYYANFIDVTEREQEFFCPNCFQPVKLCKSKNNRFYFRHLKKCVKQGKNLYHKQNTISPYKRRGESFNHLTAKDILESNFISYGYDTYKEFRLSGIDQTADLITVNKKELKPQIIEFQKSIITPKILDNRHQEYLQLTNQVRWLIDYDFIKKGINRHWFSQMLLFDKVRYLHLYALDIRQKQLVLLYHIPLVYRLESYSLKIIEYSYEEDWLMNIFNSSALNEKDQHKLTYTNYYKDKGSQRKNAIRKNKTYLKTLKAFYSWGLNFQDLPEWIFTYHWQFVCFKQSGWVVLAWSYLAWINTEPPQFTNKLRILLVSLIEAGHLSWTPMPLMNQALNEIVCECIAAIFNLYQN